MSAQYDYARPAKQAYSVDTTRLHMASKTTSYLPPSSHRESSSRRMPVGSTSMPQTSWLSETTEFGENVFSQPYSGGGAASSLLRAGSMSEAGQHSLPRAQSRDYMLPTKSQPNSSLPSGSRSQSRKSPSPVPRSPTHVIHTSRSFGPTSPHKTSGMLSDRSDRDASGHLDLKRLMSKPARQTPSGSVSLPSDSERSADASSSRIYSRRPSEGAVSHPPLSRSASVSREKLSLHVNTTGLRGSSAPRLGHSSSPERRAGITEGQAGKQRNVLRRKPSSRSNPGPSTGTIMHTRAATEELQSPSKHANEHELAYLRDDAPFASYAKSTGHASSTTATQSSSRSKASSTASRSPRTTASLTPAGAVALAYKQQEERREALAETASYNDAYRPPSAQRSITSLPERQLSQDVYTGEDEEGSGPYYTVFGSTTGRLIAVGSPEDDGLHGIIDSRVTVVSHAKQPSRSLSRKVSGSIKRVTGTIKRDGRENWKPFEGSNVQLGRNSPLQSPPPPHNIPRKPVTLDMSLDGRDSPKGSPTTKFSPASKTSPSPQEDGRASRSSKLPKGKDREEDMSPGGRWWKLMKRISTGGLREKYQLDPAPPPPVPALPQNIPASSSSRTTMDITDRGGHGQEVSENGVLLRRFMQSRSSMSGIRPSLGAPKAHSGSSRPSTSTGTTTAGRPSTGNTVKSRASISGHRPSTATRSSSPGSSEKASSGFFNNPIPTPSSRSSISSYGDEVPPVPKNLGQYIVSPSELSRMAGKSPQSATATPSKRSRSHRAQTEPPEALMPKDTSSPENKVAPSLPLPPRRATTIGAVSPIAASFNVEDTVNNLMPPQPTAPPPLMEFGAKEPPPRPKRSSKRVPPPPVDLPTERVQPPALTIPSRTQSMSAAPPTPVTPRGPPQVRVDTDALRRRPSVGAMSYASTARQPSASSSHSPSSAFTHSSPASALSNATSPSSAVSQKRSPLTFRELESPRQRLTEKEKADKWEDLLQRSARAGGTLHLGENHLMSDDPEIDTDDRSFLSDFSSDT